MAQVIVVNDRLFVNSKVFLQILEVKIDAGSVQKARLGCVFASQAGHGVVTGKSNFNPPRPDGLLPLQGPNSQTQINPTEP